MLRAKNIEPIRVHFLSSSPGSESYAPLARAILGGLSVSVTLTVFLVPAAYVLVYGRREAA